MSWWEGFMIGALVGFAASYSIRAARWYQQGAIDYANSMLRYIETLKPRKD
jgi:hypothetical protein